MTNILKANLVFEQFQHPDLGDMVGIHKKGGGGGKKVRKAKPKTYQAEKIIGNGSFGVVYKACYTQDGEHVAIKKVY